MPIPVADNPQHVHNLASIPLLKEQGFEGPDASLTISLFEYNLVWRDLGTETLFIYPVRPECYDRATIANDLDVEREYNWVNWDELMSFLGAEKDEWLELPISRKIYDIVNFHGIENVFGTCYWEGFKVTEE